MAVNQEAFIKLLDELSPNHITLVAVSKTKTASDILALYNLGQRDFGENYIQELAEKQQGLPQDICWHFIGHLQTNKVKFIAPFVHLIHGVDSLKLLTEINKQGARYNRIIDCLLQVHIAQEETKFGLSKEELDAVIQQLDGMPLNHIKITGLMGMASFTEDAKKIRNEFRYLKSLFDECIKAGLPLQTISMGMSSDYKIAIEEGSNMVRIGSLLFGERTYTK